MWVVVVEIDSVLDAARKSLGFCVSIKSGLLSFLVIDADFISVWGIELGLISV